MIERYYSHDIETIHEYNYVQKVNQNSKVHTESSNAGFPYERFDALNAPFLLTLLYTDILSML